MASVLDPATEVREDMRGAAKGWWLFLAIGITWFVLAFIVLQFDDDSASAIGLLTGIVVLAAGINELIATFALHGWKWLHGLLAALFLITGVAAIFAPFWTFGTLALLTAWFLLVVGAFDIVAALFNRDAPLWWLGLVVGIIQVLIGFWAAGYPGRSAALLIAWVGFAALFRGFTYIFLAFQIRHFAKDADADGAPAVEVAV